MVAKKEKVRKKESRENLFFSVFVGLFLVATVSFLVISNLRINQKRAELIEKIEDLQEEIALLEGENLELESGLLETESETYWEEKAREQGYKKPGEEAVVVLPPEDKEEGTGQEEKNIFQKILDWFRRD